MTPTVVRAPEELADTCERARREGRTVGLVPTMGALHAGHGALIEHAASRTDFRVVTIFVNPLQFGPKEDLSRYPRTFDADLDLCARAGVDLVFAPAPDAMYPAGFETHVDVESITTPLEGAFRPGHFRGVTTVVAKLFCLVGRSVAVFGRKDYQQWRVIDRMAEDLGMPIEVVGRPTIREPDGLALSSRNRYLDAEARGRALALSRGLRAAWDGWAAGERDADHLTALARAPVAEAFDRIDYVATVDPSSLAPLRGNVERAVILAAAYLGTTRLIDNSVLGEDARP